MKQYELDTPKINVSQNSKYIDVISSYRSFIQREEGDLPCQLSASGSVYTSTCPLSLPRSLKISLKSAIFQRQATSQNFSPSTTTLSLATTFSTEKVVKLRAKKGSVCAPKCLKGLRSKAETLQISSFLKLMGRVLRTLRFRCKELTSLMQHI